MRTVWTCMLVLGVSFGSVNATAQDGAYESFVQANRLASAGAITRSIPHYEKTIEAAPDRYPKAFFNLAEVFRAKSECSKAAILYAAYAAHVGTDEARSEATRAVKPCRRESWIKLEVTATPENSRIRVDGYPFPEAERLALELPRGEYTVAVAAVDHHETEKAVQLDGADESVKESFKLEAMKFYGTIEIEAPEGSKVRVHKGPDESTPVVSEFDAPGSSKKVLEGRHFVSVTREGFRRWIRNVDVRRDEVTRVEVDLVRELPAEIR